MTEINPKPFYLKGYYLLQQMIVRLEQINMYAQSLRDSVTPEESYRVINRLNVLLRDLADNGDHDEIEQELETETETKIKPQL